MDFKYDLLPDSKRRQTPISDEYKDGFLSFGQLRSDHMFLMEYDDGVWKDARIVPYGPFQIAPGAIALHYGQSLFEGAKAFVHEDGEIYTWRVDKNAERLNRSGEILCMPPVPVDIQVEAIHRLIDVERKWCPNMDQASLYIRPFMFATEDAFGVRPSKKYIFSVLLSPSGPYYSGGFKEAITLLVTEKFHRAVPGGTGAAKAAGNYAASMRAAEYAHDKGAVQVLYLDSTNQYIEEVGSMNHFHITKDNKIVIPEFTDTILRSITSESIIELGKETGFDVVQERIKLDEFIKQVEAGEVVEAGGFGTAAVVSPVGKYIFDDGREVVVGNGKVGDKIKSIYEKYTKMQTGKAPAPEGWLKKVEKF